MSKDTFPCLARALELCNMISPVRTLDCVADMAAINNEDWKSIGKKIDAAIAKALADLRPTGWANAVLTLRQIGTLANILAVFLALLAVTLGALYQSFAHVKEETQFRTHTEDHFAGLENRLERIEASLLALRASRSPDMVFRELAKLQPRQFSSAVPALQAIIEHPVATVAPEPATLQQVAVKLSQVGQATPDYWSTTLNYIQWASAGMSPNAPPPGGPQITYAENVGDFGLGTLHGKTILLSGGSMQNTVFDSCRIIFTERPIVLKHVTFINCVFEFPITNQPLPFLKHAGEQLLAEGIQHAVVSLL